MNYRVSNSATTAEIRRAHEREAEGVDCTFVLATSFRVSPSESRKP
jgi:hypothetical protein